MSRAWKTLSTRELLKSSFFKFRVDQCELPDGRVMPAYYVMEFGDWVNIVPVTEDNKIIFVEQYRHALGETTLEIPGGAANPAPQHVSDDSRTNEIQHAKGEKEDPKKAAIRELLEETGYMPDDVRLVGKHSPNPAMQNNHMHTYVGFNCKKIQEPELDPYEDIRVVAFSIPEVIEMIMNGKINHSIVVASILYALPTLGFHLPMPERKAP